MVGQTISITCSIIIILTHIKKGVYKGEKLEVSDWTAAPTESEEEESDDESEEDGSGDNDEDDDERPEIQLTVVSIDEVTSNMDAYSEC